MTAWTRCLPSPPVSCLSPSRARIPVCHTDLLRRDLPASPPQAGERQVGVSEKAGEIVLVSVKLCCWVSLLPRCRLLGSPLKNIVYFKNRDLAK